MARKTASVPLRPSLLDRLTDREPKVSREPPSYQTQSRRELKESLRRDLEWLLNARRTIIEPPETATELAKSVYNYGVPDFTNYATKSAQDKQRLARVIEIAILNFEPRLSGVTVAVRETSAAARTLKFQIEALLKLEPAPERVFFDAQLEVNTSHCTVEGGSNAK
jgi:type VI secretion system protein ImpF